MVGNRSGPVYPGHEVSRGGHSAFEPGAHLLMVAGDRYGRDGLRRRGRIPSPRRRQSPTSPAANASPVAVPHRLGSARQGRGELPVRTRRADRPRLDRRHDRLRRFRGRLHDEGRRDRTCVSSLASPGAEFDGVWSPDGEVHRVPGLPSRDQRGRRDLRGGGRSGSEARNLTNDPANDWGPDWSPDGRWIAFNSDRDGFRCAATSPMPRRSEVHRSKIDAWFEYPSFSPDGTHIVFMGHAGSDYDIYVVELETGETTKLTDAPGSDGWPVWSPDGSSIAFASRAGRLRAHRTRTRTAGTAESRVSTTTSGSWTSTAQTSGG